MLLLVACNEEITDFGFEGSLSGKVIDQSGNIVAGDITSGGFVVKALGEHDEVAMTLRVKGDGTFSNMKLFPQKYQVWVEGPVVSDGEVTVDLTGNKAVTKDFVVTPFLAIDTPVLSGSATSSEMTVTYRITGNAGYTVATKELYCSMVPYPNASTGSGPYYTTIKLGLSAQSGTVTIAGLTAGTKYFIRVGAKANGASAFNYSDQLIVTTP